MGHFFKKTGKIIEDSLSFADGDLKDSSRKYSELAFSEAKNIIRSVKIIENGHPHILVAGLSKSGKSTLINCLAHSKNGYKVSPTRRGAECTSVPSVIEAGDSDTVKIFNRSITYEDSGSTNANELGFQQILDHLRGIEDESTVQSAETFDLKDYDKLIRYVTTAGLEKLGSGESKPQMAYISVSPHEDSLIAADSIKLSIIDSPGLDGEKAGTNKHEIHSWLQGNVDMIIIVHSSLAAVTHSLCEYVQELHHSGRKPVVILLYNDFVAKHWRQAVMANPMEGGSYADEINEAKKMLVGKGVFIGDGNCFTVNLGMAEDALFEETCGHLLEKSNFPKFRESLRRFILDNGRKEMERTRLTDIRNNLLKVMERLNGTKKQAGEEIKKIDALIRELEKIKPEFSFNSSFVKKASAEILTNRKLDDDTGKSVLQAWNKYAEYVGKIVMESGDVSENIQNEISLAPISGNKEADANRRMKEACTFLKSKLGEIIENSDYRRRIQDSLLSGAEDGKSLVDIAEEPVRMQLDRIMEKLRQDYDILIVEDEWSRLLYSSDEWLSALNVLDLDASNFDIPWYEPRKILWFGHSENDLKEHFKVRLCKWRKDIEKYMKAYVDGSDDSCEALVSERKKSWNNILKYVTEKGKGVLEPRKEHLENLIGESDSLRAKARKIIESSADFDK